MNEFLLVVGGGVVGILIGIIIVIWVGGRCERNLDLLLGDAQAENERLKRELKYQDAQEAHIGTHSPECWSFGPKHYDCAIRHIVA